MIRSKTAFNIYVRLNGKTNLMAATYNFSENMGTKKIVDILSKGIWVKILFYSITCMGCIGYIDTIIGFSLLLGAFWDFSNGFTILYACI